MGVIKIDLSHPQNWSLPIQGKRMEILLKLGKYMLVIMHRSQEKRLYILTLLLHHTTSFFQ